MVRITNGIDIFEVTSGAYENNFKKLGFIIMDEEKVELEKEVIEETIEEKPEELIEKPLSEWTKAEVREYAKENDIDLTGTKNVKEAKEVISTFLK